MRIRECGVVRYNKYTTLPGDERDTLQGAGGGGRPLTPPHLYNLPPPPPPAALTTTLFQRSRPLTRQRL